MTPPATRKPTPTTRRGIARKPVNGSSLPPELATCCSSWTWRSSGRRIDRLLAQDAGIDRLLGLEIGVLHLSGAARLRDDREGGTGPAREQAHGQNECDCDTRLHKESFLRSPGTSSRRSLGQCPPLNAVERESGDLRPVIAKAPCERLEIPAGVVWIPVHCSLIRTFPRYSLSLMRRDDFERLYEEHAQPLFGFLAYRTGDTALAEDLLADTFERALRARARFDQRKASEKTWLYAIALNLVRDSARRRGAEARALERIPRRGARDVRRPRGVEHRDEVRQAMAILSDEEREAIALQLRRRPDRPGDGEAAQAAAAARRRARLPLAAEAAGRARLVGVRGLRRRRGDEGRTRPGRAGSDPPRPRRSAAATRARGPRTTRRRTPLR